ncbi:MAG TPA: RidA family protein [Pyrinomonadaceae bacterium]|nr:RidA family protein [Pyrinomonadaceae bacterium]
MPFTKINPSTLGAPRGYSNGILTEPNGRLLFVAGQIGCNQSNKVVSSDFVEQFDQALANVLAVVTEAGGSPDQVTRLTMYVTDRVEYVTHQRAVGERYRDRMGKHFPAMALIEVKGLLDPAAKVEIEGTAVL